MRLAQVQQFSGLSLRGQESSGILIFFFISRRGGGQELEILTLCQSLSTLAYSEQAVPAAPALAAQYWAYTTGVPTIWTLCIEKKM